MGLDKVCAEIADKVVPEYRNGKRNYSCTSWKAKCWNAAYEGGKEGDDGPGIRLGA